MRTKAIPASAQAWISVRFAPPPGRPKATRVPAALAARARAAASPSTLRGRVMSDGLCETRRARDDAGRAAHELDRAGAAQGGEAVVGEEVAGEDGAVAEEALGELRLRRVHEGEGLDRRHAPLVTGADAGQEEALQRPRARGVREVGAG